MVPIFLFLIVKNFGFFWLWSVVRTLHCFIFDFWDKMLTYVVTFKTLTKNYLMNLFTGNFIICFNVFHCFTIILLIGSCFASEICFYHMVIIFYVLKDFSKNIVWQICMSLMKYVKTWFLWFAPLLRDSCKGFLYEGADILK